MKATKFFGDIKRFLHPGGGRQQTMLQYVDDTNLNKRGGREYFKHIQLATTFSLINELKIHLEKFVTYWCH
jgi:hypothetical protein